MCVDCGLGQSFFHPADIKPNENSVNRSGGKKAVQKCFLSSGGNKAPLWERDLKCEWLGLEATDVFVELIRPQTPRQTNH